MTRAGIAEATAWFAFYAAFGVFALAANNATPAYNAVYVEHSRADWVPAETRDYMPPAVIEGSEQSAYFGYRWWRPAEDHRWGRGARNEIVVVPSVELPTGTRIVARIGVLLGGRLQSQEVIVEANGTTVLRETFTGTRDIETSLPEAIAAGEELTIAFIVPDVQSPVTLFIGADPRPLGVRLERLALYLPD